MAKIYDPDIVDNPVVVNESDTKKNAAKATEAKVKPEAQRGKPSGKQSSKPAPKTEVQQAGTWQKVVEFCRSRRAKTFAGAVLGLFGVYLLIIFISYMQTGAADQSLVTTHTVSQLAAEADKLGNAGSSVGANMAHAFIYKGFGLAAFIIAAWCIVVGLRMVRPSGRVQFLHFTLMSLVNVVACVMVLGGVSLFVNPTFFPLGGNIGHYCNKFLQDFTGTPGMIITDIIVIFLWALICYKTLRLIYDTAKKIIPKPTDLNAKDADEDAAEEEDVEDEAPATDKGVDKQPVKKEDNPFEPVVAVDREKVNDEIARQQPDDNVPVKEKAIPSPWTEIKSPSDEAAASEDAAGDDIESTITVSGPIEQGDENRFEAYDPTKELSKYKMPTLDLLREGDTKQHTADLDEQEENKKRITETLAHYDIQIKKIDVCVGPTISLFEIQPCDGVRISKIKGLGNDIQMSLAALGIRIIAPIPGKCTIGIEVPNKDPQTVYMRSILGSAKFQNCKMELPMALGCTITNDVAIADLTKMPHLLVAGATGQGKSVGLNAIIASLLYKKHPSELKLVLIDPKMVEFSLYSKLEHHYLAKLTGEDECIVIDPKKAIATLNSLVQEMENRNLLLRDAGERNIKDYNAKFIARRLNPEKGHRYMPYIVLVVDEYADLVMTGGKEIERPIARIAQKARAVGIHMIIATQRPSTDVITGMIKANFPGRIAFKVVQMVDSRTILDCPGAEQLVGRGDMLFSAAGSVVERIQCAFIDTPEVEAICDYISGQVGYDEAYELPEYIPDPDEAGGDSGGGPMSLSDRDPLFDEIAQYIVSSDTASTSSLQRHYGIGYNRAGRIMDQMEAAGIVGPSQGGKPRKVLVDSVQLQSILSQ